MPQPNNQTQFYRNVMEPLVAQEVERQMKRLPTELIKYLNAAEAIAYALNRLPALYATSEEGWKWQQKLAQQKFKEQIVEAARWGLAAVQRDPLRVSTPLVNNNKPTTLVVETEPTHSSTPAPESYVLNRYGIRRNAARKPPEHAMERRSVGDYWDSIH